MNDDEAERTLFEILDTLPHYVLDDDKRVRRAKTFAEYCEGFERHRVVAQTTAAPGVEVSTIFLGIDSAGSFRRGPPLVFETMIFGGALDRHQWRHATYDEALAGHKDAVASARRASGLAALPKLRGKQRPTRLPSRRPSPNSSTSSTMSCG
jgi:hypothetical protein